MLQGGRTASTEDAYVKADIAQVAAEVSGRVQQVLVRDHAEVEAGSPLVKLAVVVGPNGNVKETKVIGGHPILVSAAVDAVKKWKFETASGESTGTVEFRFDPGN